MPDAKNKRAMHCAKCEKEVASDGELYWGMYRENTTVKDDEDLRGLIEARSGLPTVVMLSDNGEFVVYSIAPSCENCFNENLTEYEEQNTPPDMQTTNEFKKRVVKLADERQWTTYTLQFANLSPRGFPNLALIRDDRLLLIKVRGDVSVRMRLRAPAILAQTLLISPEVPEEIREMLLGSSNQQRVPNGVTFLYMDEKYVDPQASPELQVTSLTGLLVSAKTYPLFRYRLLRLLPHFNEGAKSFDIEIHASDLFRDLPDKEHFAFYEGLVSIVNEFGCRIYRRGFNFIPAHELLRKRPRDLVGMCFRSMLIAVQDSEGDSQIWPVMEIDHTKEQDRNFAGYVRLMDTATAHLQTTGDGVEELIDDDYMVDNSRVGDVHFVTKQSIVGSAVDCLAYLLHWKWQREAGSTLTPYKSRLARIASTLNATIVDDYVGTFRLE